MQIARNYETAPLSWLRLEVASYSEPDLLSVFACIRVPILFYFIFAGKVTLLILTISTVFLVP